MNRKTLARAWLFLLLMAFVVQTGVAQQLVQYEYWFDQDYAHHKTASVSGTQSTIKASFDVQGLTDGLHQFNLRVKQSDGYYSPVTSGAFLKFQARDGLMLEYWFDDDFANRGATVVESSDSLELKAVMLDLDDDVRFPVGAHRLNVRVASNGSYYSPVYSGPVLKLPAGNVMMLQYWFDDNLDNRGAVIVEPSDSTELRDVEIDLSDNNLFPMGMHRLYMRVATEGNNYSPIYISNVFKFPYGDVIKLEYWVDDHYDHKNVVSLSRADGLAPEELELNLQNSSDFPFGAHRFNTRVVIEGYNMSPIYTDWLTKQAAGSPVNFEYWLDKDYAHRRSLQGTSSAGVVTFDGQIDLSGATPGIHRLYSRCTSNSGHSLSPVAVNYIMVKSRYNHEDNQVTVTRYRYWVDDEEAVESSVGTPSAVYVHPFQLDASRYADGVHTVNLQYQNSAGVWGAANQTYFATEHPAAYWMPEGDWTIVENQQTMGDLSLAYCNGLLSIDCDSPELNGVSTVCVYSMSGLLLLQEEADSSDGLHVQLSLETPEDSNVVVRITSGSCHYSGKLHCTK